MQTSEKVSCLSPEQEADLSAEIAAMEVEDNLEPAADLSGIVMLYDKVLVEQAPVKPMSELIELPDNLKEPPFEGTVIRVGSGRIIPGVGLYPLVVKVGDYVHFNRYCGVDIILGKKPFKVLREDELLFIKRNAIA